MTAIAGGLIGRALDRAVPETWTTLSTDQVLKFGLEVVRQTLREVIDELETSKKCDPYTGELFDCECNNAIEAQIQMLIDHFKEPQ